FILFISINWYSERVLSRTDGPGPKFFTFMRKSILVRVLMIALIVGALGAGVLWMGGQDLASKFAGQNSSSSQKNPNAITRQEIWHASWQLIKHNPWTGAGFGTFFLAIPQYQVSAGTVRLEQAHNEPRFDCQR